MSKSMTINEAHEHLKAGNLDLVLAGFEKRIKRVQTYWENMEYLEEDAWVPSEDLEFLVSEIMIAKGGDDSDMIWDAYEAEQAEYASNRHLTESQQ